MQQGGRCDSANANGSVRYINNFWLSGVTHNVTGMTRVHASDSPTGTSSTVPPTALYSQSAANENFQNITAASINGVTLDNQAWGTYTPTVSAQFGSPAVAPTAIGHFKQIGKRSLLRSR